MDMKYKFPPVVEAICEFRFSENTAWDNIIPGVIYEKIKSNFPLRNQRTVQELKIEQKEGGEFEQRFIVQSIIQLSDIGRNNLVQVGNRLFTINALQPYITWENYSKIIHDSLNTLICELKALNPETNELNLKRIGLRYINRIVLPIEKSGRNLQSYFTIAPKLQGELEKNKINSFISGLILEFDPVSDCKVELTSANESPEEIAYSLDIDYFTKQESVLSTDEIMAWVNKAHSNLELVFEGVITQNLRDIFNKEK